MMKSTYAFITAILFVSTCFAQTAENFTCFRLPITAEQASVPTTAFVTIKYFQEDNVVIKSYAGTNNELKMLSSIIGFIYADKKTEFLKVSDKADTMANGVFDFYKYFVSHSKEPIVLCHVQVGIYTVFFVRLETGFPAMTFCLAHKGGKLLNNPQILQHPAVVALTEAINKRYLFPDKFTPQKELPVKNRIISFDDGFGDPTKGLNFYFDLERIKYSIADTTDTAGTYMLATKPVLDYYKKTITTLAAGDMESYYTMLEPVIREALKKSFKVSGSEKDNIDNYRHVNMYLKYVNGMLNLGDVKILFVDNQLDSNLNNARKTYLLFRNDKKEWLNTEYYMETLMGTKQFQKALTE